jgi:hypothetical protein
MTTIIYNAGKLFADSRVCQVTMHNGVPTPGEYLDTLKKIYEPQHLRMGGRKILALTVCGQAGILELIKELDALAAKDQQIFDLGDGTVPAALMPHIQLETRIMMVTTHNVAVFSIGHGEASTQMFKLSSQLAMGSGVDKLPSLINTVRKVSSEVAMADAMAVDCMTGGPVSLWQYGSIGVRQLDLKRTYSKLDRYVMSWVQLGVTIRDVFKLVKNVMKNKTVKP